MSDPFDHAEEERDKSKTRHIDTPLGEALRLERDARGLTQKGLAKALDISASTVQKYEEGRVRIPAARLWQLCNLLDVDVAEFFQGLPHSVARPAPGLEARPTGVRDGKQAEFLMDDGRGRKAAAVARAASKLRPDRLDIAIDLIKALRPKPKADV